MLREPRPNGLPQVVCRSSPTIPKVLACTTSLWFPIMWFFQAASIGQFRQATPTMRTCAFYGIVVLLLPLRQSSQSCGASSQVKDQWCMDALLVLGSVEPVDAATHLLHCINVEVLKSMQPHQSNREQKLENRRWLPYGNLPALQHPIIQVEFTCALCVEISPRDIFDTIWPCLEQAEACIEFEVAAKLWRCSAIPRLLNQRAYLTTGESSLKGPALLGSLFTGFHGACKQHRLHIC